MKATIKIRVDFQDKTHSEISDIVPKDIANEFLTLLVTWKDRYTATYNEVEQFQKEIKAIPEKVKR